MFFFSSNYSQNELRQLVYLTNSSDIFIFDQNLYVIVLWLLTLILRVNRVNERVNRKVVRLSEVIFSWNSKFKMTTFKR